MLVLAIMLIALLREWAAADVTMLLALFALSMLGVVDVSEALSGFANPGVLTVAFLFVVAAGVESAGLLDRASQRLFGAVRAGPRATLARVLFPVAGLSALVNNTPLVAVLVPSAMRWSRVFGARVSRILMPLSFATILGGMCTLIGTSTNLLVSGLMVERGLSPMTFFELAPVGALVAVVGTLYLVVCAPILLPERDEMVEAFAQQTRSFIAQIKVGPAYAHVGQSVEQAGLRQLKGLFLFQIVRGNDVIAPVEPAEIIRADDRLSFTGVPETLVELSRLPGLSVVAEPDFEVRLDEVGAHLYEVVISHRSPLIGKTVRASGFRGRYGAAILAVHRHGERLAQKIGDVALQAGDTLLLMSDPEFYANWGASPHFYVVTRGDKTARTSSSKTAVAAAIVSIMLVVIATGAVSPLLGTGLAAVAMVASGVLAVGDARRAIDMKVMAILGSSLGLGLAVERAGLAHQVAEWVGLNVAATPIGWLALAFVVVITAGLSLVASNHAAAAIGLPMAIAVADVVGADPRPFSLSVALAASLSFATPLGYQTNLLVWGPGNYRFSDFVRLGAPLTVLSIVVTVAGFHWMYLR